MQHAYPLLERKDAGGPNDPAAIAARIENGLKAFETFKTDLAPKLAKLDALDEAKLAKVATDVASVVDIQQKAAAEQKAIADNVKAIEATMGRMGMTQGTKQADELKEKTAKAFKSFAKSGGQGHFDEYLSKHGQEFGIDVKALSVVSDADGGFLVMPHFGGVINTKVYETSPMRQLANVETISTDSFEVLIDHDEAASGGWVGETQSRTDTGTPKLGKIEIRVHEQFAQPKATQKVLDDAAIDIEAWLAGKVSDKLSRTENTAFISGNGTAKPRGILSYDAGTDITLEQIEQVVSGSASTYTYAGLVDLQVSLKEVYQSNASFLSKRTGFGNLMKIVDGQNRPIFNLTFDKNTGLASGIMGRPLLFADDMPAVALNALSLAYGDFKKAYTIVDRMGIRILRDPYTDKPNIKFYTTKRVGGAVVNFEAIKLQKIAAS